MLDKLTADFFQELMNESFDLSVPEDTTISFQLIEVKVLPSYLDSLPSWRQDSDLRQNPFAIVFKGPKQPALEQGMYTLSKEAAEILIENVFLGPIDEDNNGRYYEAVFN